MFVVIEGKDAWQREGYPYTSDNDAEDADNDMVEQWTK